MTDQILHHTFTFERHCNAPRARVFAALADPVERARWSTPSDTAVYTYEAVDFREDGKDVFLCGNKEDPQFTGVTRYLSIQPEVRIVSSEVVESGGKTLMASLISTELANQGSGTRVRVTVQVASFAGEKMLQGTETGNNAALDNLVAEMGK